MEMNEKNAWKIMKEVKTSRKSYIPVLCHLPIVLI